MQPTAHAPLQHAPPLEGKVLITGGAGFLGRGLLCMAQQEDWDAHFVVVSRDQQKHELVKRLYSDVATCAIADILDTERMYLLMTGCDYVLHAAALKHLPECEAQPSQAIRINVDGTRSVMRAAAMAGVKRVVCVSTDKAAAPLNTYGMTKALVERMVHETLTAPVPQGTTYTGVRYGNVIASTGSVWHVFKQQCQADGQLSVTDPDMSRFFVTIAEAIGAVLTAFAAPAGTVVIPTPRAMRIGHLADHLTDAWRLQEPKVTGMRFGEKQHEDMVAPSEVQRISSHNGHFLLHGPTQRPDVGAKLPDGWGTSQHALAESPMSPQEFVYAALDGETL